MNLMLALTYRAALDTPGTIDGDVREALEAVIRTLRTMDSGLYYESRPQNPLAASIYGKINEGVEKVRKRMAEQGARILNSELVAAFVFLQREALFRDNGRRKCRAFLDILHRMFPDAKPADSASPLLIT